EHMDAAAESLGAQIIDATGIFSDWRTKLQRQGIFVKTGEGVVWSPDQDRKRVALRVDDASRAPVSESCWKTNRLTRTASNHPMFPDKWTVQRRCHGAEDEADDDPSP